MLDSFLDDLLQRLLPRAACLLRLPDIEDYMTTTCQADVAPQHNNCL